MRTLLTKPEKDYIVAIYEEVLPKIKSIKDIKEMPLGCAGLFMENREEGSKKEWPNDHSISEKYLFAHGLPKETTYAQWEKWIMKQPKRLR